ncbi:peptidase S24 [Pedobacter sp. KBW01]|uniref:S24 family peptidase n=1 Tax=Pedobacter sp. KBW01 TaxID=2153364 RepID=UPI000F590860|nr:S24 family peptidase [Pedobacter sp. KBW01]RQO78076.1 peptidase S24 [Pedobacter sp. KBW01]
MVAQRLSQYIEDKGISLYAFENKLAVSRGSISKAIKENKSIGSNVLENILSKFIDINPIWLMTGRGKMIASDINESVVEPEQTFLLKTDKKRELQRIPLYDTNAAASVLPTFNGKHNIIDYITIPNMPSCDGALPIIGDSMYPLLKSGDIVMYKLINDLQDGIYWGEMYLVYINEHGDDMTLVKYVQKSDKGDDYIKLVSQNQHHAPKDIKLKKVKAMALIKASIRINSMS